MKIFWIVLILAILFVVGTASALRYFENTVPKKEDGNKK